jgi:competence protein CoiA
MSTQFAIDRNNRIVHVSEVQRGLGCACACAVCGEPMVAKKGLEREHHFAHDSNKADCAASYESLLHRFAKRVIQEEGGLAVPPFHGQTAARWLMFDRVEEEVRLDDGSVRPDIVGYTGEVPTLIEVAYSSFADDRKIAKLAALNLQAVEIDLHDFHPESFDPEAARQAIRDDIARKRWLFELSASPQPERNEPRQDEKVTIKEIWVFLKDLPFGDLAIRVPAFNPEVNAIIKGIAKQNHGWWKPEYKNWIVPRQFKERAKEAVREAARQSR